MSQQIEQIEKEHSHYVGEVINSLMREAAYWKARFNGVSAENDRLRYTLKEKGIDPTDHYIEQEPVVPKKV